MLDTLGFRRRVLFEGGRAILEFECGQHMCHSGGVAQGGFVTGWIDAAMAHSVFASGREGVTPMSLEMKVSFFAPARPGPVIAEGWLEKAGGQICFAEGTLKDSAGTVLARASSTLRLMSMAKVEAGSKAAAGK